MGMLRTLSWSSNDQTREKLISQAPPRWWTGGSTAARRLIAHRLKSSTRYSISFSTISNICIAQPPPSIDLNHKLEIEEEGIYAQKKNMKIPEKGDL